MFSVPEMIVDTSSSSAVQQQFTIAYIINALQQSTAVLCVSKGMNTYLVYIWTSTNAV